MTKQISVKYFSDVHSLRTYIALFPTNFFGAINSIPCECGEALGTYKTDCVTFRAFEKLIVCSVCFNRHKKLDYEKFKTSFRNF